MVFKQFNRLWVLADMPAIDTQGVAQPTLLLILIHNECEFLYPIIEICIHKDITDCDNDYLKEPTILCLWGLCCGRGPQT